MRTLARWVTVHALSTGAALALAGTVALAPGCRARSGAPGGAAPSAAPPMPEPFAATAAPTVGPPASPAAGGTCPAFVSKTIYVDAHPAVGADGACCGRAPAAGPGGPCLTVGQALANLVGAGWTVRAVGGSNGNASPSERYPLHLGAGVTLAGGGKICFPGVPGRSVFSIDQDGSTVQLQAGAGGFFVGTSCQGVSGGATDGVYVGQAANGSQPTAILEGLSIGGVQVGLLVAAASAVAGDLAIQGVGTGVYCESPGQNSTAQSSFGTLPGRKVSVVGAANEDLFAAANCTLTGAFQLGAQEPCPIPKLDTLGVVAQGNAHLELTGSISCMNSSGILLGRNHLFPGSPSVAFHNGRIAHCGCAGLLAGAGTVSADGAEIDHNHYGAELQPGGRLVLSGPGMAVNRFFANSRSEPGSCCQGAFCPPGADLWNASGEPAPEAPAGDPAVAQCSCEGADPDGTPRGCRCTGTTLHDGLALLNLPAPGPTTGGKP